MEAVDYLTWQHREIEQALRDALAPAEHHHRDEENKLFPAVREKFDDARREALGREMQALQLRLQAGGKPRRAVRQQTAAAQPLR